MNLYFNYWRNRFSLPLELPLDSWLEFSPNKLSNAISLAFQTRPQQDGAVGLWNTMNNKKRRSYPSLFKSPRWKSHPAVLLDLKTWSLYCKRFKVETDVQRTSGLVWFQELLKVQASPCREKFNLDCKSAKHILYRHNRIAK